MESVEIHISQSVQHRHSPACVPNLSEQKEETIDPGVSITRTKILIRPGMKIAS